VAEGEADVNHRGWQGAIQILNFNRRWYACGTAVITCAIGISLFVAPPWRYLLLTAAAPALFWLIASVAVSHYVYDRSHLYDFEWLGDCLSAPPRQWVTIHAGLDETGRWLSLPGEGRRLDIFDPREMTEPSVRHARRLTQARSEPADWRALPLPKASQDAVLLIFAAHELRPPEARVQLLREAARILRGGGQIILAEHLRDWRNFLAFGPGFMHFFSERDWLRAAAQAGLEATRHSTITPFVHIFVLRRANDSYASADCGGAAAFAGSRA
jgi:hypothetical protein